MTGRRHAAASTYAAQCALLTGGVRREIESKWLPPINSVVLWERRERVANCKHTHTQKSKAFTTHTHTHRNTVMRV